MCLHAAAFDRNGRNLKQGLSFEQISIAHGNTLMLHKSYCGASLGISNRLVVGPTSLHTRLLHHGTSTHNISRHLEERWRYVHISTTFHGRRGLNGLRQMLPVYYRWATMLHPAASHATGSLAGAALFLLGSLESHHQVMTPSLKNVARFVEREEDC